MYIFAVKIKIVLVCDSNLKDSPNIWPFMAVQAGNSKQNTKAILTLQISELLNMAQWRLVTSGAPQGSPLAPPEPGISFSGIDSDTEYTLRKSTNSKLSGVVATPEGWVTSRGTWTSMRTGPRETS